MRLSLVEYTRDANVNVEGSCGDVLCIVTSLIPLFFYLLVIYIMKKTCRMSLAGYTRAAKVLVWYSFFLILMQSGFICVVASSSREPGN